MFPDVVDLRGLFDQEAEERASLEARHGLRPDFGHQSLGSWAVLLVAVLEAITHLGQRQMVLFAGLNADQRPSVM